MQKKTNETLTPYTVYGKYGRRHLINTVIVVITFFTYLLPNSLSLNYLVSNRFRTLSLVLSLKLLSPVISLPS